jgi:hypothetical protein
MINDDEEFKVEPAPQFEVQIQSLLGSILGHTSQIKTNVQKRKETSLS